MATTRLTPDQIASEALRLAVITDRVRELAEALETTLTLDVGGRYIRLVQYHNVETLTGAYVHAFVDKTNGDLLKAAGWKAPAKGARGNLLDDASFQDVLRRVRLQTGFKGSTAYLYRTR
jgi:hypothetical protein